MSSASRGGGSLNATAPRRLSLSPFPPIKERTCSSASWRATVACTATVGIDACMSRWGSALERGGGSPRLGCSYPAYLRQSLVPRHHGLGHGRSNDGL